MDSKKDQEKENLQDTATEKNSAEVEPSDKNQAVSAAQQDKLKKKVKQADHEEDIKNTDPKELRNKLSNKNSDYIFRLEKFLLDNENFSMDQVEPVIDNILPEIIIAQHKGLPASTLYQMSPSQKAHELAHPKAKPVKQSFWLQVTDTSLFYLALFGGLYGIVQLFSGPKAQKQGQLGVITLLVLVFGLGILMAYYNNWIVKPKSDRQPTWKVVLGGIGSIILMFVWVTATSLKPFQAINPPINPWALIVIAVIAFGVRYYLKKRYHIVDPVRQARMEQARQRDEK